MFCWTFSPQSRPRSPRMVPGAETVGSVAPARDAEALDAALALEHHRGDRAGEHELHQRLVERLALVLGVVLGEQLRGWRVAARGRRGGSPWPRSRRITSPVRPRRTPSGLTRTRERSVMGGSLSGHRRGLTPTGLAVGHRRPAPPPGVGVGRPASPATRWSGTWPPQVPAATSSGLVARSARALLHRRLVERYGEHGGRRELLAGAGPQRRRPPGDHVVDDQVERVLALRRGPRPAGPRRSRPRSGSSSSGGRPSARRPARRAR